jgi:hypothetical protein
MRDPKLAQEPTEAELHDAPGAVIPAGALCKRRGCGYKHEAEADSSPACTYHAGSPVFHEGSKGWTCCARKVLEFDEFLKIRGCTQAPGHRFTDATTKHVACRHDWYQTQSTVILSVFGKGMDPAATTVSFTPHHVGVEGRFKNGDTFSFASPLFQPIRPEACKYVVLGTKVELTLAKANGLSWPALEPTDNVVSFTTFGCAGGAGTVGAKEAIIATDMAVEFLKK